MAVAVAGASLTLAACGGDDDSNSQLSYADFGKEANRICKEADDKADPIGEKLTGDAQNDAPLVKQALDIQEPAIQEFKDLKPPKELQADFDTFVAISDEQLATLKKAEAAARAGDTAGYRAELKKGQARDAESDAAASRLGAAECAND